MQAILRLTLLYALSLYGICVQLAHADEQVLPPPKHSSSSVNELHDTGEMEDEVNLNKELAPPAVDKGVDVRTYLRQADKATITEYSSHGRVFRIKVQPAGDLPAYYLEDIDGDGTFDRRTAGGYKRISPPMWVIKRF